jgi:hypothetical protein
MNESTKPEAPSSAMDRYAIENAVYRVDGYFYPEPHELALGKEREAFERAKRTTLHHMRIAIEQTEALTADQFLAHPKRSWR